LFEYFVVFVEAFQGGQAGLSRARIFWDSGASINPMEV
jgi:hypothetical protein